MWHNNVLPRFYRSLHRCSELPPLFRRARRKGCLFILELNRWAEPQCQIWGVSSGLTCHRWLSHFAFQAPQNRLRFDHRDGGPRWNWSMICSSLPPVGEFAAAVRHSRPLQFGSGTLTQVVHVASLNYAFTFLWIFGVHQTALNLLDNIFWDGVRRQGFVSLEGVQAYC